MLCMVEIKLFDKCNSHKVKAAKLDKDDDGILSNMLCETSNLKMESNEFMFHIENNLHTNFSMPPL